MNSSSPIERLNYHNGQRLDAADLRVEQGFHMRVRHLLNQSLFTPGIAAGLDVEKVLPEPSHAVRILPGLALDSLGREIILVEPSAPIRVAGKPTKLKEPVSGNYLIIEYAEEAVAFAEDGCAVRIGVTCRATEDLIWGAPSRIRAKPKIYIQHPWPQPKENKIVLAQLELKDEDCSVRDIRTFVRKYVSASKPPGRALAWEGEKDLDEHNQKHLYFHFGGGARKRAALYLRGSQFSTGANMPAQPERFLQDLRVSFDLKDITPDIITQLEERDGKESWITLGDGKQTHPLSKETGGGEVKGTGEIDLLRLGLHFSPGDHSLKFSVGSGRGKLHYNLYVE